MSSTSSTSKSSSESDNEAHYRPSSKRVPHSSDEHPHGHHSHKHASQDGGRSTSHHHHRGASPTKKPAASAAPAPAAPAAPAASRSRARSASRSSSRSPSRSHEKSDESKSETGTEESSTSSSSSSSNSSSSSDSSSSSSSGKAAGSKHHSKSKGAHRSKSQPQADGKKQHHHKKHHKASPEKYVNDTKKHTPEVDIELQDVKPKSSVKTLNVDAPVASSSVDLSPAEHSEPPKKKKGNPLKQMTVRQWFLIIELIFLSVAVMFVELCLVPALPEIMKQFYDDADWVPWILSIYNIVGAVWTPIAGSLADMFGTKWITVASLCVYMVGQVICALSSSSIFVLIAGRALQGFGMAIFVLALTIVRTAFPDELVTPLMGIISSMMSVGMSVGIVGGAAALESIQWHTVFWITFPIIFVFTTALAITIPGVPKFVYSMPCFKKYWPEESETSSPAPNADVEAGKHDEHAQTEAKKEGPSTLKDKFFKMDLVGAFLLAAGVIMILMSFTFSNTWGWEDAGTICLVIIGFALLVALVFWELWVPRPIIPVRSLMNRDQLVLIFISITSGLVQFALFQMLPYLYMEPSMPFQVAADDMLQVGLYLLPFGVAMIAAMPGALGFGMTLGYPVANVVSAAVSLLGVGLMIEYHDTSAQTVILNTIAGVGLGMMTIAIINMITVISKASEFGAISGANLCLKFVGGSLGPVLVTIFLNKHSYVINYSVPFSDSSDGVEIRSYTGYSEQSFRDSFIFLTAVAGAALLGACTLSGMFKFLTAKGRKEIRDLAKMSSAGGH
ncbi:bicyclomycin/multidrug efflux system [Pelomyxa schiedti]|nr:bicyclomycin/multidrug efflux system [Pelomyxa schiedti]